MSKLPVPGDVFSDPFRRPVVYNPATKQFAYINPRGAYVPISGDPAPPTVPVDKNTYPLKMKPVAKPGDPVTLGVGSDTLVMTLSSNPNAKPEAYNVVALLMNGKAIAGPLTVSAASGGERGQVFTIKGEFGPAPHLVTVVDGHELGGLKDLWWNGGSINFVPLLYNGPSMDARGSKPAPNSPSAWDNTGIPMVVSETEVVVQPPAPPAEVSTITGASINGQPAAPATLAGLVERTPAGGTLVLPAGRFVGTCGVHNITVQGQPGATILDATGLPVAFGKAILVPTVSGFVGKHLILTGASGPDGNCAAVRQQGDGISFTLEDCEIYGCQDGLLTFSGDIKLTRVNVHDCGNSDGLSHAVYASGDTPELGSLTLVSCALSCGMKATHALKSRFGHTTATDSTFEGNPDDGHVGGSVVDLPNGGIATLVGGTVRMGRGAGNHQLIGFALENANNAGIGMVLTLDGVAFDSQETADGGKIENVGNADLIIRPGCSYTGPDAPQEANWRSINGSFPAKAA